ncbi:MAG: N-acetylmuramidase family protein [Muribaculaceae bacterium]|nr:N-acetylmuramidase family protein [Muribaculaceae bacterium]
MKRTLLFAAASLMVVSALNAETTKKGVKTTQPSRTDSIKRESKPDKNIDQEMAEMVSLVLTSMPEGDAKVKYKTLTEEDFRIVAKELGVEVAAIKAVVKIEAGPKLEGFWAPGVPVVNYAQTLFNKYNGKTKGRKIKDAKVPQGLSGYALKEWTSLTNARKINADAADMGTYWGMFQIGGFNYKLCGCESVEEMVAKVCESEFSQLEMFAVFIRNSGMLEALKKKDWAAFARKYNGPSYAKRGYHTRMAKEYANFKSNESSEPKKSNEQKTPEVKSGVDQKPVELSKEPTDTIKKSVAPVKKNYKKKRRRRRR